MPCAFARLRPASARHWAPSLGTPSVWAARGAGNLWARRMSVKFVLRLFLLRALEHRGLLRMRPAIAGFRLQCAGRYATGPVRRADCFAILHARQPNRRCIWQQRPPPTPTPFIVQAHALQQPSAAESQRTPPAMRTRLLRVRVRVSARTQSLRSSMAEHHFCTLKVLDSIPKSSNALPTAVPRLAPWRVEGFTRDPPAALAFTACASR